MKVFMDNRQGKVRVGRRFYEGGKRHDPHRIGYSPIVVLTKSSKFGSLSPYCLKDEKGRIMENVWQFSKVYPFVRRSKQSRSRYDRTVIWDHPPEVHATSFIKDGKVAYDIKPEYLVWRRKGMACRDPVRYPVGFAHRHECLFSLAEDVDGRVSPKPLNYIQARKEIYLPLYTRLVREQPDFKALQERLRNGENLLIIEVDGPHGESLPYYMEKYQVEDDFILDGTMLATEDNLRIMLKDEKHPFGHGYCLAAALLELEL